MGVFSRLGTLIKANINDLISRAEDPEKILNQLIVDMREQMIEAQKQVAASIADEKKLKKQLDNELQLSSEWEKKAMMAVRAGRDDLATEALNRKQQHQDLAAEYQKQHELQKRAADQLRTALRQLNQKIEEARRKKDLLIARQRRAEAQKRIQETMAGFGETSAFEAFDRMSSKVDRIEAEAEASAELAAEMGSTDLDQKFRDLEGEAGASEALLELKRKMGVVEEQKEEAEEEFDFEALERELAAVPAQRGAGSGQADY
ncbi:MAG: PspA/IM30 family protein [Deltaproteobacteria bacterium]|nr:MAG: PspA/IM30 family protein [Deltaproteobacteria bacterium]